ncbi:MAG: class I SAM-dependent methyltransferase [Verrucomicrobia bacterium]|nr:class I SAM-dependent methyltransferase [Verrucomicrobiota bacterium]
MEVVSTHDRDASPLQVVMCPHCGLVWNDPRPSADALAAYYREEYRQDYKGTLEPKPRHTLRAARVAVERCCQLRGDLPRGEAVLDLGAGGGEVVYVLRQLGFPASGIEPNAAYARFARERLHVPVTSGIWQEASVEPGSLSAVTLFHVLEHLDSPLHAMRLIQGWLRTGGLLWIEVPNVEAVCQAPSHRFHRAHLYNFNTATLDAMGRRAGFEVVRIFTSADGGTVTSVLRKTDGSASAASSAPSLPGNADRIRRILAAHTPLRHFLSAAPYLRPLRKLKQRVSESLDLARNKNPKNLMEQVLQEAFRSGVLSVVIDLSELAAAAI